MEKKEFEYEKKLQELKHQNKMDEIKEEKLAKIELEKVRHEHEIGRYRLQRRDRFRERGVE